MQKKKFKAPDNIERYVALTSGHCWRIAGEWVSIPEFAWQDCYAAGCISEDILRGLMAEEKGDVDSLTQKKVNNEEEIRAILLNWMEENKMENFTTNGSPKLKPLSEELGRKADRGIVDGIWFKIQENK